MVNWRGGANSTGSQMYEIEKRSVDVVFGLKGLCRKICFHLLVK